MTKPIDPFSRLYWRLIDDEKFAEVYPDDHHFALWARLLMAAEMAWPASAALPFGARRASVDKLVEVGLVDLLPGNRYRIHGMDDEQGRRRPGTRRDPDGTPTGPAPVPKGTPRARPRDVSAVSSVSTGGVGGDAFETYTNLTGSYPSRKASPWLSRLIDEFGEAAVDAELVAEWGKAPDPATFLGRVQSALEVAAHRAAKAADERRRASELEYQRAMREEAESMPIEQRQANMARLKDMLKTTGLA